jgi:hypothetical protein
MAILSVPYVRAPLLAERLGAGAASFVGRYGAGVNPGSARSAPE